MNASLLNHLQGVKDYTFSGSVYKDKRLFLNLFYNPKGFCHCPNCRSRKLIKYGKVHRDIRALPSRLHSYDTSFDPSALPMQEMSPCLSVQNTVYQRRGKLYKEVSGLCPGPFTSWSYNQCGGKASEDKLACCKRYPQSPSIQTLPQSQSERIKMHRHRRVRCP